MKKTTLIIIAFFAFNFMAKSQKIDNEITSITACKIKPIQAKITDELTCNWLGMKTIFDDLKTSCTVYYQFILEDKTISFDGNLTVDGEAYKKWDGSAEKLFAIVGKKLKIEFEE